MVCSTQTTQMKMYFGFYKGVLCASEHGFENMKISIKLLVLYFLTSSCKPEYVNINNKLIGINNKLIGTWELNSLVYIDNQDEVFTENGSNYIIKFNKTNKGILEKGKSIFSFTYNFGYEKFDNGYATCNMDF